jgi:hypothetical protein
MNCVVKNNGELVDAENSTVWSGGGNGEGCYKDSKGQAWVCQGGRPAYISGLVKGAWQSGRRCHQRQLGYGMVLQAKLNKTK